MVKLVNLELADITVGLVAFVWVTIPLVFVGSNAFHYLQIPAVVGAGIHQRTSTAIIFDSTEGALVEFIASFIEEAASTVFALHFLVRVTGVYASTKTFAQHTNFSLPSMPLFRVVLLTLVAEKTAGVFHEGGHLA